MITIGRGYRQQKSILTSQEVGMHLVAKNRIGQAVGMQNARAIEALKVDGVPLQIFTRHFAGQICSCSIQEDMSDNAYHAPNNLNKSNPLSEFEVVTDFNTNEDEEDFFEFEQNFDTQQDFRKDDNNLNISEDLINEYALKNDNSLINGGDKTPCAICFGTGYKNGYDLFNGQRIVLDYFDKPLLNGFSAEQTYPYSFNSPYSNDNYIEWSLRLPTYFKKYFGIRVRNNYNYCKNYKLYISVNDSEFVEYNDQLINNQNGKVTNIKLRINPYTLNTTTLFNITHLELFFQYGEFPYGDFAPLEKSENFEYFEALRTTSLELAGDIGNLERESVICDNKNNILWKVVSITPHYTVNRQIFKNELSLRMIQQSEVLSCLNLINNPFVLFNYRGLEQKQAIMTYSGSFKE